ncbi:MAG: hypothetical protein LBI42_10655 [Chitinispirillales bacterium]|jgi:hypothetical protein|nr:hypothetical protein [Chitinispirillales bacterium]
MLLDHDGYLSSFIVMSNGKCSDIRAAGNSEFGISDSPPNSILTVDRDYIDYKWLNERGLTLSSGQI